PPEWRPALPAELHCGKVLVLAPGTRHAVASQRPGRRKVGTWAETNRPGLGWSRTRAPAHTWGRCVLARLSSVVRCPPRRQRAHYSACLPPCSGPTGCPRHGSHIGRQPAAGRQSGSALTLERLGCGLSELEPLRVC